MSELEKIMKEEKTREIVGSTFGVLAIMGSVVLVSYVYSLKYGKIAEEKWKADSLKEVRYQDSLNRLKQDTIYHLKLDPKVLMYPDYEVKK